MRCADIVPSERRSTGRLSPAHGTQNLSTKGTIPTGQPVAGGTPRVESAPENVPQPRRRRRVLRRSILGALLLAFAVSLGANVLLYRRADLNYRLLSQAQLDPLGLKHPDFPPDVS